MTENTVLSQNTNMLSSDMNGSTVLMDTMTGKYYNLGDIGGRIWELLNEPMTVGYLVRKLTMEYDVSAEQCRADILPFLEKLVNQGLLLEL